MLKKVLYISRSYSNDSPVGVRYLNFIKRLSICSELTVLNISRDTFLYSNKNYFYSFISRIIFKLPFLPDADILILNRYKKEIKKKLTNEKFDTVIISVLPHSFMLLPAFIKQKCPNCKVIVDVTDPPSANINFNSYGKYKKSFLLKLERESLQHINVLIVLNREIKNYYQKMFGYNCIEIIEQGFDKFENSSINLNLNNKKHTFTYAGQFYRPGRDPKHLYEAFVLCNNNVLLQLYGSFNKRFNPPSTNKIISYGRISKIELEKVYIFSDVIIFIDNMNSLQVPGKTYEVLSIGKPILFIVMDENSPTLRYFNNFQGVFYVRNSCTDILRGINDILSADIEKYERDLSEYYWDKLLMKLDSIL